MTQLKSAIRWMSAKAETLDCVCARAAYALTNAATWATMSTKMMIFSAGSTPDRCRLETLLILSRPFSVSRSRVTTQRNLTLQSCKVSSRLYMFSVGYWVSRFTFALV